MMPTASKRKWCYNNNVVKIFCFYRNNSNNSIKVVSNTKSQSSKTANIEIAEVTTTSTRQQS
ncbi:unnamed protein product [Ceratitis capitata]|uniref:(Mediterranean fruit fly) hypothetical protein n=1 Tax=Ceratitis capitata TaxID=7213 RepID=A0A811US57_CERCA|nr:unnamed protein product [Ceratitis capitata]